MPQAATPIAAAFQPFIEQERLAGAVLLVATADEVLALETVGFTDLAARQPMPADALFWIASMTKPMTASALMILVEEGKAAVDDPVEKYVPEFKEQWLLAEETAEQAVLRRPQRPLTLRNLLTHTGGLAFRSPVEEPTLDVLPLRSRVRSYTMQPRRFEAGTRNEYSNAGINTIGRIIELVAEMPYETFLQTRLLEPLGMRDTTLWPTGAQIARLAKSYRPNSTGRGLQETPIEFLKYPLNGPERYAFPAGGLFSTAEDAGRFGRMILRGGEYDGTRILSPASVHQMTTPQIEGLPVHHGFCWQTMNYPLVGHGGAYGTHLWVDLKSGLTMVLLTQHAALKDTDKQEIHSAFLKAALQYAPAH